MIGRSVSHYEIIARLGSGGMGEVYRARDTRLDRTVVLKFLPPARAEDDAARARFLREARAASRLDHASICTIYDIDELDDGTQFISMAHCDGENLADRLAAGPLPPSEAARIALRVAEGLVCAHEHGVIHRDLKPANIQLTSQGEVKILDFGVARLAGQERLTGEGTTVGTVPYMAPEQVQGDEADHRSDFWSLGVLLYEMLTGQRPFHGETVRALMGAIIDQPTPDPVAIAPNVPTDLAHLARWCLEKDPADRPQQAGDLVQPLRVQAHITDDEATVTITPSGGRRTRPSRGRLVAVSAALVAVLLVLVTYLWPTPEERNGVALLPWSIVGGDARDQRLGDGMVAYLGDQLLLLAPSQPAGWVAPPDDVRLREITGTDRARGRLGVGDAVSGTLHLHGDVLRLDLLLHDTGARAGKDPSVPPRRRTVVGSRDELVAWTDEILATLVELVGWQLPRGVRPAVSSATHSHAALAAYLDGLGAMAPLAGRSADRAAAKASFVRALAFDPDFAAPRVWLGRLHASGMPPDGKPDYAAALAYADTAIALSPGLLDGYFLRGRILLQRGDTAAAEQAFRRCLDLVAGHGLAQVWLADTYRDAGEPDSTEAILIRSLAFRPDDPSAHLKLGAFYFGHGRLDEASASFARVVELAPDLVDGYINLGSVAFQQGNWRDAESIFLRSIAIEPDPIAYTNLGTIYFYERRLTDAGRMYELAIRLQPGGPLSLGWAAECYWWGGVELERARTLYTRAAAMADSILALSPGNWELAANLASYLIRLGDVERAAEIMGTIVGAAPRSSEVRYVLATCCEDLGDRAGALENLELALRGGYPRLSIEANPGFDNLRQSPEYRAVLARIDEADR